MQRTEATRVLIIGVNGAMGQHLAQVFTEAPDFQVAAGIDLFPSARENAFPVYENPTDCKEEIDLLIDFSKPGALDANLNYARSHQLPIIIATTGYSDTQKQLIAAAAKDIPVFFTANMSLGVNLQLQLCQQAAKFFGDLADIEIIEKHHNRKVDAPSGTALLLADGMNDAMGNIYHYQCERHGSDCKRKPGEIGIHAVRGGNIAGDHEVSFITNEEILTVSHHAETRKVFAIGALRAARFLIGRKAGLYSMLDVLAEHDAVKKATIEPDVSVITVKNASCTISYLSRLTASLAREGIKADLINQSAASQGRVNLSFSIKSGNLLAAEKCICEAAPDADYMIQRGLCKYTIFSPEPTIFNEQLARFLALMAGSYIDILLLSMLDNQLTFFTEGEYQQQVTAFIKQCC